MIARSPLMIAALAAICAGEVMAGDWPQILGPQRDGIAVGEALRKWSESGPELVWAADVGQGFAGVAVRDNVVYAFHRVGADEVVEARAASTGDLIWKQEFPCRYRGGISSDSGPRCVPLVTGQHVYVFGVGGALRCLRVADGQQVWSRDTAADFDAPDGYFGAGSTPILHNDKLIVNVGSRKDAAVVAFAADSGETQWQSVSDTASYSSPMMASVDGVEHALVVTRYNMLSLNPDNGDVRFQFPFGMRGPTVNGATPVVLNGYVFVSASYRVGSVWAKITNGPTDPQVSGEQLLATQYATPIKDGDVLYAVDGRQDIGRASIKCIDPAAQQVLWEEQGFDYGTMVKVGQELLFLTCGGELLRIAADRTGYKERHRSQVLDATPRGYRLPSVSNGRLFVRDDRTLKCLQIGPAK